MKQLESQFAELSSHWRDMPPRTPVTAATTAAAATAGAAPEEDAAGDADILYFDQGDQIRRVEHQSVLDTGSDQLAPSSLQKQSEPVAGISSEQPAVAPLERVCDHYETVSKC